MTTIAFENRDRGGANFVVEQVNRAAMEGRAVTVDGRPLAARRDPAAVWGNGSVSFAVQARNGRPGSWTDLWVKTGQSASIEIAATT